MVVDGPLSPFPRPTTPEAHACTHRLKVGLRVVQHTLTATLLQKVKGCVPPKKVQNRAKR